MSTDYGYSALGNEFVEVCKKFPPDFDKIREVIGKGVDINEACAGNEGYNLLASVILDYASSTYEDGRHLPEIVAFFLENGFDVSRDEGRYGAMCLQSLIHSSNDEHILNAAEVLLKAGAQFTIPARKGDDTSVLEWTYTEGAVAEAIFRNYDLAALLDGMSMMMESYR